MTLREFLEQNPDAVKKAANCKSAKEFENLVYALGITFNNNQELERAFDLVKSQNDGVLNNDALEAVSGGAHAHYVDKENLFYNYKGECVVTKSGKKVK